MTLPPLALRQRHVLCSVHGEPFRAEWPLGYQEFAQEALKRLMKLEEFKRLMITNGGLGKIESMLEKRPICCWLNEAAILSRTFEHVNAMLGYRIWKVGYCSVCLEGRFCFKTKMINHDGSETRQCFNCLCAK